MAILQEVEAKAESMKEGFTKEVGTEIKDMVATDSAASVAAFRNVMIETAARAVLAAQVTDAEIAASKTG